MSERIIIENKHTTALDAAGFVVVQGWGSQLAEQLVRASREPEMQKRVARDQGERFVDAETASQWYQSNDRVVYALGKGAILAGVIWYSHDPRPELQAEYTFAIRMYEAARGQGLSAAFLAATQYDFEIAKRHEGGVWLETDHDNVIAQRLYEKSGYSPVNIPSPRTVMVRSAIGNSHSV